MAKKSTLIISLIPILLLFAVIAANEKGLIHTTPGKMPPRAIPGIVVVDNFPNACVDCHVNYTDMKLDLRLTSLMKQLSRQVDSSLLAKAQAAAPTGMTLEGKHPDILDSADKVPEDCLLCHYRETTMAPPFSRLMHLLHLTGGEDNLFMTLFQGECTHCHKLDMNTGQWTVPSGKED